MVKRNLLNNSNDLGDYYCKVDSLAKVLALGLFWASIVVMSFILSMVLVIGVSSESFMFAAVSGGLAGFGVSLLINFFKALDNGEFSK